MTIIYVDLQPPIYSKCWPERVIRRWALIGYFWSNGRTPVIARAWAYSHFWVHDRGSASSPVLPNQVTCFLTQRVAYLRHSHSNAEFIHWEGFKAFGIVNDEKLQQHHRLSSNGLRTSRRTNFFGSSSMDGHQLYTNTERTFAANISLVEVENHLVKSFGLPESSRSYLTAHYQYVPSAYCLTLVQDILMETVSVGTAFNELKNRCLETKVIKEATPRGDIDTMKHLLHLQEFANDPYDYKDVFEAFELTSHKLV